MRTDLFSIRRGLTCRPAASRVLVAAAQTDDAAPVRRGRGRPAGIKKQGQEDAAQVRRGRGRPTGSKKQDQEDQEDAARVRRGRGRPAGIKKQDPQDDAQVRRGRGRPAGSKNKNKEDDAPLRRGRGRTAGSKNKNKEDESLLVKLGHGRTAEAGVPAVKPTRGRPRKQASPKTTKGVSGWHLFVKESASKTRADWPAGWTAADALQHAAGIWAGMSELDKGPYKEQAEGLRSDVQTELAAWKTLQPRRRRGLNRVGRPKRSPSAWLLFTTESMKATASTPSVKLLVTIELRRLAGVWKGMSQQERQPYIDQAQALRPAYLAASAAFNALIPRPKAPRTRPMPPFTRYVQDQLPALKAADPGMHFFQAETVLAPHWQALPESERQLYRQRFVDERAVYKARRKAGLAAAADQTLTPTPQSQPQNRRGRRKKAVTSPGADGGSAGGDSTSVSR